jgi:DNA-binding transcriptional LysR family regulator
MDPHLLRTFVAVARHGSFSAAARDLGYTQAAVSQHIAALEGDLKVRLLTRRPVVPTEAGRRLLEHAAPILLRLDAARADVTRLAGVPHGLLHVGSSPLAAAVLAAALARLLGPMPRLELTVRVAARETVAAGVAAGDLDIGLVDGLAAPSDPLRLSEVSPLTAVGVGEEQPVVVLPGSHPLAARAGLGLADLVDARWIDAPGTSVPLGDLRRAAGTDGFRAAITYEGTDTATLAALAAAGHGLTVLPARAAGRFPGVASVPVTAPRLVHRTELLHGSLAAGSAAAALAGLLAADRGYDPAGIGGSSPVAS